MTAAANGQEQVVELFVATACVNLASKDSFGRTPLSWASKRGDAATVKLLVDKMRNNVAIRVGNELFTEKESLQNDEVLEWCDVCTRDIPRWGVYYKCGGMQS